MTTIDAFITEQKITMTVKSRDATPDESESFGAGASHWTCTLRIGRRRMSTPFSMGAAHTTEPEARDVLNCLASDALTVGFAASFEEWCAELGYSADSRAAERTYRATRRQAERLCAVLGDEAYKTLLYSVERL